MSLFFSSDGRSLHRVRGICLDFSQSWHQGVLDKLATDNPDVTTMRQIITAVV